MAQFSDKTALITIDVQQGFIDNPDNYFGTQRNNPQAEQNIARLIQHWREQQRPLFFVKHHSHNPKSPLHPDNSGNAFQAIAAPHDHETVITKTVNSALIGTDLETRLQAAEITQLVIVGLVTNHCVSTTARMAANLGFETYIVADACACFDRQGLNGEHYPADLVHQISLASLQGEFATMLTTDKTVLMS